MRFLSYIFILLLIINLGQSIYIKNWDAVFGWAVALTLAITSILEESK